MITHQTENSVGNVYGCYYYEGASWNAHVHRGYEFLFLQKGKISATIKGEDVPLTDGDCVLIPPFAPHAFRSERDASFYIVIFSGNAADAFEKERENKVFAGYKFRPRKPSLDLVKQNLFSTDKPLRSHFRFEQPDFFQLKAAIYAILAEFKSQIGFAPGEKNDANALNGLLTYIENNFRERASLKAASAELGYNYQYLSKVLNSSLGVGFNSLVNRYRADYAFNLIKTTDKKMTEIAMESGFSRVRSFNRIFAQIYGAPPTSFS